MCSNQNKMILLCSYVTNEPKLVPIQCLASKLSALPQREREEVLTYDDVPTALLLLLNLMLNVQCHVFVILQLSIMLHLYILSENVLSKQTP